MGHLRAFLQAVGGKLFLLPAAITGLVGLVGILQKLGLTSLPEISWWAIILFVVLPLSGWSIIGLLNRVVALEREIDVLRGFSGPPVSLSETPTVTRPNPRPTGGAQRAACITIANIFPKSLEGCLAKIEEATFTAPVDNLNLPRAVQTLHQPEGGGRFDLRRNETKTLVIASRTTGDGAAPITLEFENGNRRKCPGNREVNVRLTVYTEGTPVSQWVKVSGEGDALKATLIEKPD